MRKIIALFLFMGVFSHPCSALESKSSKITGKISLGYDNLIITQAESKISHSFSSLYLDYKLPLFPHRKRRGGVFRLQNGFKFQNGFKATKESENILFNQANLGLAFLISPKITSEILGELKCKSIFPSDDLSVKGEYGYLYWHSGVSLKYTGNDFTGSIRYLHHERNYTDKDFFDTKDHQFQLTTDVFFSHTLTGCLTGKVETSRLSRQQNASLQEHADTLYEMSIGAQWVDDFLINPSYAFQMNNSDHSEYSFNAHRLSILAALPLYWKMTFQCYGHLQLCKYKSQKVPSLSPPDEDNIKQSHNVLVFSLSRDIFKDYSVEIRYLLSRSDISSSSEKYARQSCSLTVSYEF